MWAGIGRAIVNQVLRRYTYFNSGEEVLVVEGRSDIMAVLTRVCKKVTRQVSQIGEECENISSATSSGE